MTITLGGRAWTIERARLGGFLRLQQARESINKGIREFDNGGIVGGILDFLRVCAPDLTAPEFFGSPWQEVLEAYISVENLNRLPHAATFAIIQFPTIGGRDVPWDNPLRAILIWIHLIATTYSWTKTDIEALWPEEAIGFVQEILADQQAEREFVHSLSEVAYEYDKRTKKSRYKPLKRPVWMVMRRSDNNLITVFRRDMMPVGMVVYPKNATEGLRPHAR